MCAKVAWRRRLLLVPRPDTMYAQLLYRNVQRFRGGLVCKAHRLLYHSTPCVRVIKKKNQKGCSQMRLSREEARGRACPALEPFARRVAAYSQVDTLCSWYKSVNFAAKEAKSVSPNRLRPVRNWSHSGGGSRTCCGPAPTSAPAPAEFPAY